MLLVSQPVGLVLALAAATAVSGDPPSGADWAAGIAAGAAASIALGLFYAAMVEGAISIVAPVASAGAILPVVVGLARGEDPGPVQLVGLVLALAGVVLASREADHPGAARIPRRSLVLAAASGIGFGLFFVGLDAAASSDPLWAITAVRVGGVALIAAAAVALYARGAGSPLAPVRPPAPALPILALIGLLDVTANTMFAIATGKGLLALVSVAGSLYPVSTVLLAHFVLGERLVRWQRAGVALALGGVALLAAG